VNRAVRILIILGVGSLVLWESISWGTRTWVKYGLVKEPLPSLTTLLPTIQPVLVLLVISVLIFTTISAVLKSRRLFGIIPMTELNRHLVVLGPTGSGKTTVAKAIIAKTITTSPQTKIVIIDWKGEYVKLFPDAAIIRKIDNVWNVPGESAREKALVAVELIREMSRDTVEITPPSSLLLLRVLTEEYERGVPTTEKIVKVLERHAEIAQREGRYAESNMYLALIRRLFILLVDEERKAENAYMESQITIYDLGSLPSIHLKTLYSNYVLMSIYRESTRSKADGLRTIVVAEEAQNYVPSRRPGELPTIAERIVYELRSYGVGVILVCPDPELLPAPVLKDVGAIVATSPDSLPRFALERYLFRASLEEAEKTLKELKKAKLIIYHKGNLHYLRRLPKPPKTLKPKERPKGDRMGVTDPGGRSLRAWPILPHRPPGILAPKVIEVKEELEERPKVKVIEVKVAEERTEVEPKTVEAEKPKIVEEPLRLEEEEPEEISEAIEIEKPEPVTEPEKKVEETVEVKEEKEEMVEEEVPMTVELEPAPKGPPIPSSLPYRGSLCPAGRSATLGRVLF
jgi:DNA segregation ATPase FtsK/SpoIIIE-like protein